MIDGLTYRPNATPEIRLSDETLDILKKFVEICEREAMWDKVGQTYYNARNILKTYELL